MSKLRYLETKLRIQNACMIQATAYEIQGVFATAWSRNFCLLVCNLKLKEVYNDLSL
jgi:hypothetical protein